MGRRSFNFLFHGFQLECFHGSNSINHAKSHGELHAASPFVYLQLSVARYFTVHVLCNLLWCTVDDAGPRGIKLSRSWPGLT